jgi:hypothetical protein
MRTILYSSERVTAGSADAAVFICFLLVFAVSAAYYVLKHGLEVRRAAGQSASLTSKSFFFLCWGWAPCRGWALCRGWV